MDSWVHWRLLINSSDNSSIQIYAVRTNMVSKPWGSTTQLLYLKIWKSCLLNITICLELYITLASSTLLSLLCLDTFIFCSVGGTSGAIITCPLDVLKTRQQSSIANYSVRTIGTGTNAIQGPSVHLSYSHSGLHLEATATKVKPGIFQCLR